MFLFPCVWYQYLYPCCFCMLLGLFSRTCRLLRFVPMPCCIVLVVLSCITSSTFTLVPSRILFLDAYLLCALVECWTCKWYFAFKLISLHVRLFIPSVNEHCGLYVIVIIVWSSHGLLLNSIFAWSHCACSICITSFLHTMIILYCCGFRKYLFLWFKSYTNSRVRSEWVLFNCS